MDKPCPHCHGKGTLPKLAYGYRGNATHIMNYLYAHWDRIKNLSAGVVLDELYKNKVYSKHTNSKDALIQVVKYLNYGKTQWGMDEGTGKS